MDLCEARIIEGLIKKRVCSTIDERAHKRQDLKTIRKIIQELEKEEAKIKIGEET